MTTEVVRILHGAIAAAGGPYRIQKEGRLLVLPGALLIHEIPTLKRCSTLDGLREAYHSGTLKQFLIARPLAELSGL